MPMACDVQSHQRRWLVSVEWKRRPPCARSGAFRALAPPGAGCRVRDHAMGARHSQTVRDRWQADAIAGYLTTRADRVAICIAFVPVAQLDRALASGARGCRFKSCRPDSTEVTSRK